MKREAEAAFREYVAGRLERLRRTAYLLCRDWDLAEDLTSITLGKLYQHWRRAEAANNLDAYVHGILAHTWLDECRRPWRRERVVADLPDTPRPYPYESHARDESGVLDLLASLPPGQRACVVLRFYCDMSIDQTAQTLGITTGTVKSQSARGLMALRALAATQTRE